MPERSCPSDPIDWIAYEAVNDLYARAVSEDVEDDDFVWVHDYQLALVPRLLRREGYTGRIGFFLHIQFPPLRYASATPYIGPLLDGLCAADFVAFQTERDKVNFCDAVAGIIGGSVEHRGAAVSYGGRRIIVDVVPIGIDLDRYGSRPASVPVAASGEWLRATHRLISVDRVDFTKGIPARLASFERFLEQHPEHQGRTMLLQFLQRTRKGVRAYDDEYREVVAGIERVNGRLGCGTWCPIHTVWDARPEEVALAYPHAHVGVVTPRADGMNLVAKEYAASGPPDGVLILSHFAGAAEQLGRWAMMVDPLDTQGFASIIDQSISMPEGERRERKAGLRRSVTERDVTCWANRQLELFDAVGKC
jgi:trehalose-6-phosphate synthase